MFIKINLENYNGLIDLKLHIHNVHNNPKLIIHDKNSMYKSIPLFILDRVTISLTLLIMAKIVFKYILKGKLWKGILSNFSSKQSNYELRDDRTILNS